MKCLAFDPDMKRLYAATFEGLILVLNVSLLPQGDCEPCITLIHTMNFAHGMHATKLDIDTNRNIIFCLIKNKQKLTNSEQSAHMSQS